MTTVQVIPSPAKDMDLIDVLWKQDIDMGVCREIYDGTYRQKELEKEKQLELAKLKEEKSPSIGDEWSGLEYGVDSETGEYYLIPHVHEPTSEPEATAADIPLDPDAIDYNLDECIQMLREHALQQNGPQAVDDEGLPLSVGITSPQILPAEDNATAEQQWQDLASLTELQLGLPPLPPQNDTYAVNATTNGNVNLQNASMSPELNNLTDFMSVGASLLSPVVQTPEDFTYNANNTDSLLAALLSGAVIGDIDLMNDITMDETLSASLDDIDPLNASMEDEHVPSENGELTTLLPSVTDDADSAVSVNSGSVSSGINSPYSFDNDWNDTTSSHCNDTSDDGIYDDMEGATAMDYDSADDDMNAYFAGKQVVKEESQYDKYQRLSTQPPNMDNIKHNHTYPQPHDSEQKQQNNKGNHNTPGYSGSSSKKDKKHKLSRDEKRAKGLKIPFTTDKIINLPVDDFNEMLSSSSLSEAQLTLIRDIRRRGKNKIAAQHCRKRKLESISNLSDGLAELKAEKERLCKERRMIDKETISMKDRFQVLYREVFESLRDERGAPYDPEEYSLQQSTDGNVFLVPNTATQRQQEDRKNKNRRKGRSK
ncbi:endoplasmic reticulum membrane sensor NFE2L1-like isoform X2 [Saccoglossus kowalevskii]|uniref:Nuclear factor erythroid 2-related factor 1-like isoform X1 n=1 Tax=Saccoglossus kowalevskii TaxID=10224 RepID=A0ABM0GTN1_SACKO|nr:PREDICTED: nuclear factor erythroid 2-related factor 1-like isoform X1 [Saccoglossus kowalevskii]